MGENSGEKFRIKPRTILLLGGGLVLVLFVVAIIVSVFSTVNYEDAVRVSRRISARGLTDPMPGRLFVMEEGALVGRPICHLSLEQSDISGRDKKNTYEFYNVVGNIAPFLAKLNLALLGRDTSSLDGSNDIAAFRRTWTARELYVASFKGKTVSEKCKDDFQNALNSGALICTVDRAIVDANDNKTVYAIGFRTKCVARRKCDQQEDCSPPKFEIAADEKWTTRVKALFDLVHLKQDPTVGEE